MPFRSIRLCGECLKTEYWIPQFPNEMTQVGREKQSYIPTVFMLSEDYPNPFNPRTNLEFSVVDNTQVTRRVFNA
jgi:hypothetical protein